MLHPLLESPIACKQLHKQKARGPVCIASACPSRPVTADWVTYNVNLEFPEQRSRARKSSALPKPIMPLAYPSLVILFHKARYKAKKPIPSSLVAPPAARVVTQPCRAYDWVALQDLRVSPSHYFFFPLTRTLMYHLVRNIRGVY